MQTNQFAPYTADLHPITVTEAQYATSLDKRGFIPVFEYKINGEPILWDRETGDVFLTGIWKALGHTKVDIIKTVQANPGLKTTRIRGGVLKIQGTWIPYQDARSLCLRVAWNIRQQLIPLFGASIVENCLPPHHPNYRVVCNFQSPPGSFSENSCFTKKRRYVIKSRTASQNDSPPPPPPPQSSPTPPTSSAHTSSSSPMALSYILNNGDNSDDGSPEYYGWTGNYDDMADDSVVPDGDGSLITSPDISPTFAFQVVPSYISLMGGHSSELTLSPLINDGLTLSDIGSPCFDDLDGAGTKEENDIQESIETIQATILLHGLSHQDMRTARETVPDKIVVNGREFSVLWD